MLQAPARVDPNVASQPDIAADIADLYLFPTATSVIVAMDFAGPQPPNNRAVYDRNVLYRIFLSNAGSITDAEFTIEFKFGQDPAVPNSNGIIVTGLPGAAGSLVGACETLLTTANGIKVMAGLFDDPFNFDAAGLSMTRQTGALMIRNDRNRFAGMNSTTVVFEIPLSAIQNGSNPITAWATSSRFMGTTP